MDQWGDLEFNNRDWKQRLKEEKSPSPQTLGLKRMQNSTRKTPLYHNCMLEAPDGQLLCTCDTKKAHWYIAKGIGYQVKSKPYSGVIKLVCSKVSEDPLIVRLKFEPSGRPEGKAGEYYLSVKPNICVVCGVGEAYLRYLPFPLLHNLCNFLDQEKCGAPRGQEVLPCSHEGPSVSRRTSNVSKST